MIEFIDIVFQKSWVSSSFIINEDLSCKPESLDAFYDP